jgi:hypothetical protein
LSEKQKAMSFAFKPVEATEEKVGCPALHVIPAKAGIQAAVSIQNRRFSGFPLSRE